MIYQHQNNLVTVSFPNGATRQRNCTHTVVPENREAPKSKWKSYHDLYSRVNYAKLANNTLKQKIETMENKDNSIERWFLSTIAIVLISLIIASLW